LLVALGFLSNSLLIHTLPLHSSVRQDSYSLSTPSTQSSFVDNVCRSRTLELVVPGPAPGGTGGAPGPGPGGAGGAPRPGAGGAGAPAHGAGGAGGAPGPGAGGAGAGGPLPQPQPVVFALSPARASNVLLDNTTPGDIKQYYKSVAGLEPKFDLSSSGMLGFVCAFQDRARIANCGR
jgi:hypothetical protein